MKKAHDEETISQLKASQLSIEVARSQAELKTKEIMDEERVKFQKEQQILENELLRRRKEEIGKVKNDFETQLSVLKLQVQKSDELRTKEVSTQHLGLQLLFYFPYTKLACIERVVLVTKISLQTLRIFIFQTDRHAAQVEELSNTIRQNQLQIDELSRELSESKSQATQLHREVEAKGQEILNVRREANNHIR